MPVDHPCKGMTRAHRVAFEQIAISQRPMAGHKILKALREKGLIDYTNKVVGRDTLGAITVPEWFVPLHIHAQWCEWCSENVTDDDASLTRRQSGDA
jgi:hypothetical protein